ncbi:hypothetical protein CBA19CS22_22045 [Caballeronia novacaledonica]|uniref:Uncharacterized protein n=1 Tax=Caballeronia novacaledonica TaxID=1544861 RepID=A0ACB5QW98_9BURK|nr:hypothetical protein CBA19CS22_22045 [Caballeronia novacaledonica]
MRTPERMAAPRDHRDFGIEERRGVHVVDVGVGRDQREREVEAAVANPRRQHA